MRLATRTLVVCLLAVPLYLVVHTNAQGPQFGSGLPPSPLSGGVLMAEAIRSGAVRLPRIGAGVFAPEILSCSPAPCVLPNVQASEGGLPVNEDPIAVNPVNSKQLLTGGNDYNCPSLQGFFASGDGGSTWSHTCMNSLPGYGGDGDPGVAYDRNEIGRAHV